MHGPDSTDHIRAAAGAINQIWPEKSSRLPVLCCAWQPMSSAANLSKSDQMRERRRYTVAARRKGMADFFRPIPLSARHHLPRCATYVAGNLVHSVRGQPHTHTRRSPVQELTAFHSGLFTHTTNLFPTRPRYVIGLKAPHWCIRSMPTHLLCHSGTVYPVMCVKCTPREANCSEGMAML